MRALLFFPIAYLAGVQGFVFFAPYLVLVLGTVEIARLARARRAAAVAIDASAPQSAAKHPA